MTMPRYLIAFALVFGSACSDDEAVNENPVVIDEVTHECGPAQRLVTDACTGLGPTDGCAEVGDVCVALCDGLTSCSMTKPELRSLNDFPTAPEGYCVECAVP